MIREIFEDVYVGNLGSFNGTLMLHQYLTNQNLNPAVEMPLSFLMLSSGGRDKVKAYESLLQKVNWLMAKVGSKMMHPDLATLEFKESIKLNGNDEMHYC